MTTLEYARDIAQHYDGNLTVRQLYYQLVARGHIENSTRSYKNLVANLSKARLRGTFPLDWLIDRGRTVHPNSHRFQPSIDVALDNAGRDLRRAPERHLGMGRWWGQPTQVSVWVEKEALSGVFEEPCNELGVGWFACKGYPSISALHDWVTQQADLLRWSRTLPWAEPIQKTVILYFGDHDPDGWQIPRSAVETARQISITDAAEIPRIEIYRVALNMDQIELYDPPPFPAKISSSRYNRYVEEHETDDAWELDALEPTVLEALIRSSVRARFRQRIHDENQDEVAALRGEMTHRMQAPTWAAHALEPREGDDDGT